LEIVKRPQAYRSDQEASTFRGWLQTIIRRKVIDHRRDRERFGEPRDGLAEVPDLKAKLEGSDSDGPLDEIDVLLLHRIVESFRDRVEPQTWRIYELLFKEGWPPSAVAEELGIKVNSVYSARSRFLSRVREEWKGRLAEGGGTS
jgi:RNA polymerase sigma-70 factor (ECF subfamily)